MWISTWNKKTSKHTFKKPINLSKVHIDLKQKLNKHTIKKPINLKHKTTKQVDMHKVLIKLVNVYIQIIQKI